MDKFQQWARDPDFTLGDLYERLSYLEGELFTHYEPTLGDTRFSQRLADWLDGVGSEADQRSLFALLEHLYFVGERELEVLYRQAFNAQVMWWLSDDFSELGSSSHRPYLDDQLKMTWFCPITDSMQIARFHHLNSIEGKPMRPDWRTLAKFGQPQKVAEYMSDHGFTRLVLLEDFVGSGSQATSALKFALSVSDTLRILVVPLIVCADGLARLTALVERHAERVTVSPTLVLPVDCVLSSVRRAQEPADYDELRDLLRALDPLVGGESDELETRVFGFGKVGSLAVLQGNCPNNAPSAIHFRSETWAPLFPRASRH
jgi:hypothetical protein